MKENGLMERGINMEHLNIDNFKPSAELEIIKKYCMNMDSKKCLFRGRCPWLEDPETINLGQYTDEIINPKIYSPN